MLEFFWLFFGVFYIIYRISKDKYNRQYNSFEEIERRNEAYNKAHNINPKLQNGIENSLNSATCELYRKSFKFYTGKDFFPRYGLKCSQDVMLLCGNNNRVAMEFYLDEFIKEMRALGYNYSFDKMSFAFRRSLIMWGICREENGKITRVTNTIRINEDMDYSEFVNEQIAKQREGERLFPYKTFGPYKSDF